MNKSESPTLRELREQNKRSREEVAAALGVTAAVGLTVSSGAF